MLPKVNDAEEVKIIDDLLRKEAIIVNFIQLLKQIQVLKKPMTLQKVVKEYLHFFGLIDMSAELRCKLSWDQLLYARSRVVHAAAGAG